MRVIKRQFLWPVRVWVSGKMRRFKNLVIGGIENKVFNLILVTVLLMGIAFLVISNYQNGMLSDVAAENARRQEKAIVGTGTQVMDTVVTQSLARSNEVEAYMADTLFSDAAKQISFLADRAESLFADPAAGTATSLAAPDPSLDGQWTASVVYAEGTDPADPAVIEKAGKLAGLSDLMISLCPRMGIAHLYVGAPEGLFLTVSDAPSSWVENGAPRKYDPRGRVWYTQAAEAGALIFTEGEWDAKTGEYCVECAQPVYGPDGSLQAVVGMDLYLDGVQEGMARIQSEGEYSLLVNQLGKAVFPRQAEAFPMAAEDREADLRDSGSEMLAAAVRSALDGQTVSPQMGELDGKTFYLSAAPIPATGWALVLSFDQAVSARPTELLTEGFARIQQEATDTYRERQGKAAASARILLIAILAAALGASLLVSKRIVRPLNTMTKRISQLGEDNLEFTMEEAYRTGDEVEELARSFADLSHKTVEYMDEITRVTAEKERLGTELALATKIQAAMLPHIVPAFPDRKDFDVIGSMDPAKEVGGDFYDYFLVDGDHLAMIIADVSGKGVPAALFMMASKIILQSVAMLGSTPEEILTRTNHAVCSNNEAGMFVTVWVGILELSTGKLTACNAGHEYPMIKRPDGGFEMIRDQHNIAVGCMEGVRYRQYEMQLTPGSKIMVYTDGVPEAIDRSNRMFGLQRLVDALNTDPEAAPQQILKNVKAAVDEFVQEAEQFDDMTMLCLEYKGKEGQRG